MRSGLRQLAVYRDENGNLHTSRARCPHLGGVVHWNRLEKTWDCPCHGIRFDVHGRCVEGPSLSGLSREDGRRARGKGTRVHPVPFVAARSGCRAQRVVRVIGSGASQHPSSARQLVKSAGMQASTSTHSPVGVTAVCGVPVHELSVSVTQPDHSSS